ncbi:oxidoreductase [Arthrobacter echini]|uniref:Oxidoreductase n=1 Tax=Arthrobacter echini TaxID=1529066 RepID=A0A4S5E6D2_9MICC|nr:aldo/keto reductase [Arthrobacter echini]THJ67135.1 oxidoreductase [Arthrobacter echini]
MGKVIVTDAGRRPAMAAGHVDVGGRAVSRIGFGAMRLPGVWGGPAYREPALAVLRRAVELGVQVIDTAWYYGHDVANRLVADALRPYGDVVLATKLGYGNTSRGGLSVAVRPQQLRDGNERDLRVLGVQTVPVTHLRWSGPDVADGVHFDEALGTMLELKAEGRIEHIGLSNVALAQLKRGLEQSAIATVSNAFSIGDQQDHDVLDLCTEESIPYLPFLPLGPRGGRTHPAVTRMATDLGVTPAQVSLAWLLGRSPMIVPIPGTGRMSHVEENVAAAGLVLSTESQQKLDAVGSS